MLAPIPVPVVNSGWRMSSAATGYILSQVEPLLRLTGDEFFSLIENAGVAIGSTGVVGLYTSFELGPEFGGELQGVVTVFVGANPRTGERYIQIVGGLEAG